MSALIQALEKLEAQKEDRREIVYIFKNKKRKSPYLKILVLAGSVVTITLSAGLIVNLYDIFSISNYPSIRQTKPEPIKQPINAEDNKIVKDIPVFESYNIDSLNIDSNIIEKHLSDLDLTFVQNIVFNKGTHTKKSTDKKIEKKVSDEHKFLSYVTLAEEYFDKGYIEDSFRYYKKAYKIKKDEDILMNILLISINKKDFKTFNKYFDEVKNTQNAYELIITLIENHSYDLAKNIIYKFIPQDNYGDIYFAAGYLYEQLQDYTKALQFYRKAYYKNPEDQYFSYAYGRLLEINGMEYEAKQIFTDLLKKTDLDPEIKSALQEF